MVGRRKPEQGMTLVELMVTMIIASIVAASTYMFFAGQQRVYETQTKMLNVQQNAWAAMEVVSRFVRAAGSGMYGCVRQVGGLSNAPPYNRSTGIDPDVSDAPPIVPGAHTTDQCPSAGLRAYYQNALQRIPPVWIVDQVVDNGASTRGIVPGTDVITVAFGNRSSGTAFDSPLAAPVAATTDTITAWAGNGPMFQTNEFILLVGEGTPGMGGVASDIGCTLFQITGVAGDNLLHASSSTWNPGAGVAGMIPATSTYGVFAPGSPPTNPNTGIRNFGEFWWVRFAVRTTDQNGNYLSAAGIANAIHAIPVLTMERLDGASPTGPQMLAEGIEDLQVAYACDTLPLAGGPGTAAGDGVLPNGPNTATDEWMLNDSNDVIATSNALKCNQPSAIRLTLVARSLTEDIGIDATLTDNGRPAVENHAGHTQDSNFDTGRDQFRRRVLSTTVYPRNN